MSITSKNNKSLFNILKFLLFILIIVISIDIGYFCVGITFTIPSAGRTTVEIPVNPVIFLTIPMSILMIHIINKSSRIMKNKTSRIIIITIFLYSIVILAISTETVENVTFQINIFSFLNYLVIFISIFSFLEWTRSIRFSEKHAICESIFFAVSIMWLSPFITEIYIWGKWLITGIFFEKAGYMTLGGAGTQDILFWPGFFTLIALSCFHLLRKSIIIVNKRLKPKD